MAPQQPKESEKSPSKAAKLAVRFEVQLEESTDEKCAEVSYARLLWKHEMKRKRAGSSLSKSVSNLNQVSFNLHCSIDNRASSHCID